MLLHNNYRIWIHSSINSETGNITLITDDTYDVINKVKMNKYLMIRFIMVKFNNKF